MEDKKTQGSMETDGELPKQYIMTMLKDSGSNRNMYSNSQKMEVTQCPSNDEQINKQTYGKDDAIFYMRYIYMYF